MTRVVAGLALVGQSLLAACTPQAEDNMARPVPGADQVAVEAFCITISPDERWLIFVEWRLSEEERAKNQTYTGYETRVTSLNLQTGTRTRHSIDGLSPRALGFPPERSDWRLSAGYRIIEERFRPAGWVRGLFYFQRYSPGTFLGLDPSQPDIDIVAAPDTAGTCSDCPPGASAEFGGRTWDLLSNDISAVIHEGTVRAIYFSTRTAKRGHAVFRVLDDRKEELIVGRERVHGTMMSISRVRVAPNERYLAYVVHSKKQEFLAGPREELFIRKLQTGEEKLIASHGSMGNLVWSPRGERLYFAAGRIGSDGTVYVVDIEAAFGK